jgi:hypothetical protein
MRRFALAVALIFPVTLLAGKNPSDYPLQIQVIESHWNRPINAVDRRYGGVEGWGRGNIMDGNSVRGFDFSYSAAEPFHRTVGGGRYLAKWKKEGLTTVRDDVYVRGHDGAVAISQEEFKARAKDKDNEKDKDTDSDKQ